MNRRSTISGGPPLRADVPTFRVNLGELYRIRNRLPAGRGCLSPGVAIATAERHRIVWARYRAARLGQPDESIDRFDEALRWKPDSTEALYHRGVSLQDLGRFDDAVESLELRGAARRRRRRSFIASWAKRRSRPGSTSNHSRRFGESLNSSRTAPRPTII